MFNLRLFLAQAGQLKRDNLEPTSKVYNWSVRDMILVVCVTVIIASLLFLWAYFGRRSRRKQYGRYSRAIYKNEPGAAAAEQQHHAHRHRRKRRHNHPGSFPRNPTLAEAGGLPPLRPDEPPPPKPAS